MTDANVIATSERAYIDHALALADRARGRTSPNPPVGAVIVRDGQIVGEGFTQPPGGPHAEIVALSQAGDKARGGTLYVTLEPCCHFGRTPPCTDAIIRAGLLRVVAAIIDPNPRVDGGGRDALASAAIPFEFLDSADALSETAVAARRLISGFTSLISRGRPQVSAKWAMSLDGKIATATGDSRWISGPTSREHVHGLRDASDAIIVGSNTVLADNPSLTVRLAPSADSRPPREQPWRIVADSRGRVPLDVELLSPESARRTILATTDQSPEAWRQSIGERGAEALVLPAGADGRVSLLDLMTELGRRGMADVLVEGGGQLLGSLFDQRLIDRVYAYVAPVIVGGGGPGPVGGSGVALMSNALRLVDLTVERFGTDVLMSGRPEE